MCFAAPPLGQARHEGVSSAARAPCVCRERVGRADSGETGAESFFFVFFFLCFFFFTPRLHFSPPPSPARCLGRARGDTENHHTPARAQSPPPCLCYELPGAYSAAPPSLLTAPPSLAPPHGVAPAARPRRQARWGKGGGGEMLLPSRLGPHGLPVNSLTPLPSPSPSPLPRTSPAAARAGQSRTWTR